MQRSSDLLYHIYKTRKPNFWALSPLFVFLGIYLITSLLVNDFYKVPIAVAFLISSAFAVIISRGGSINERIAHFSSGAANGNIIQMIWIFILAGAFAQSAKSMGAIDATVNLTLISRHIHSFLFHLPFHRNICRNDRCPCPSCHRNSKSNKYGISLHGCDRCRRSIFRG